MNFVNHPIFKIMILRKENFFSPERRSKVVKFAKNDHLDALIVLIDPKGGPLDDFFPF